MQLCQKAVCLFPRHLPPGNKNLDDLTDKSIYTITGRGLSD